jgi:methionyl-tRNA formyltransferase
MKAIIVGAVESTRIAIESVAAMKGFDLAAVVTLPLALEGRHSDFVDLRPAAAAAGAAVIEAPNGNDPAVIDAVSALRPDMGFVIGWSQICGKDLRAALGGDVVGYHPSPLPRLRGRAVIPWTILLDEPITASSLFWIDDGVDSGPILAQRYFHVARDETATTLYARHMTALKALLEDALPKLLDGAPPRRPQDDRFATWCAKRTPADGAVDWRAPAADVERLIRAATRPYPGARTNLAGAQVILWAARPWPEAARHAAKPGQIIQMNETGFAVQCGDGAVWVDDWSAPDEVRLRAHAILGPREAD